MWTSFCAFYRAASSRPSESCVLCNQSRTPPLGRADSNMLSLHAASAFSFGPGDYSKRRPNLRFAAAGWPLVSSPQNRIFVSSLGPAPRAPPLFSGVVAFLPWPERLVTISARRISSSPFQAIRGIADCLEAPSPASRRNPRLPTACGLGALHRLLPARHLRNSGWSVIRSGDRLRLAQRPRAIPFIEPELLCMRVAHSERNIGADLLHVGQDELTARTCLRGG